MPKVDLDSIPQSNKTTYPDPFAREVQGRLARRLGTAFGMTNLGASHVVLKPGAWSSQRHWHASEDELLVMLSGEAVMVEDAHDENGGRTPLKPGDICAWPQGVENGHHIINESDADCCFLVVSAGARTHGGYSDIDMVFTTEGYFHKDGTPY